MAFIHRTYKEACGPHSRHLTLSLTGEAIAAVEVQFLHAFGDDECTDITCGKRKGGGEKRKKETVRNEGRCAAA